MEVRLILLVGFLQFTLACSSSNEIEPNRFVDVYVQDFHSDKPTQCTTTDVNLSHQQSHEFFKRSKVVDSKTIHDHYEYAPCYIEGTLKHKSTLCDWEIRAGATGQVKCNSNIWMFACDDCDDLFSN